MPRPGGKTRSEGQRNDFCTDAANSNIARYQNGKGKPQEQGNGVSFPADQLRNDSGQNNRHRNEIGYVQNPV